MRILPCLLALTLLAWLPACDDSTSGPAQPQPDPTLSTVVAGPVRYSPEAGAFETEVTVTVLDEDARPISGVRVGLELTGFATADATEMMTDADGVAVVGVTSHHLETVTVSARVSHVSPIDPETAVLLDATATLAFTATLAISPDGDPVYSPGQAAFPLRLRLEDGVGPVAGADLFYQPAFNGVTLEHDELRTDPSGEAWFLATAIMEGTFDFSFELEGIVEPITAAADLLGPVISGEILEAMSYPAFLNPRVGVFGVQVFGGTPEILGELPGSVAVDMLAGDPAFSLHLPFAPPVEWLTPVDGGLLLGYFPPALYNDENDNGVWDEDEFLCAVHGTPGALVFVNPGTVEDPPFEGWNFLDALEENPQVIPWVEAASAQDMWVVSAPVRVPQVAGPVGVTAGTENARVAFAVVDAPTFMDMINEGENPWLLLFDPAHSTSLLDVAVVDGAFAGTTADPLAVLDAATVEAWSLTQELGPGFPLTQLLILPYLYLDVDGNERLSEGDGLAGTLAPPYGANWHFSYILDLPRVVAFFSTERLFMHAGWNWWASPTEYGVIQVIVNLPGFPTLQVDDDVPAGLVDIDFEVYAAGAGDDDPPKATGRFASGGAPDLVNVTECTGCGLITVGDTLRVVEVLHETTFLDWAEPIRLGVFN
jgi:hypothetical protein